MVLDCISNLNISPHKLFLASPVIYLLTVSMWYFFVDHLCNICFAFVSFCVCFVGTSCERTGLLALVCDV